MTYRVKYSKPKRDMLESMTPQYFKNQWYQYIKAFEHLENHLPTDQWLNLDSAVKHMQEVVDEASKRVGSRDFIDIQYRRSARYPQLDDISEIMLIPMDVPKFEFIAHWRSWADKIELLGWLFPDKSTEQEEIKEAKRKLYDIIERAATNRDTKMKEMSRKKKK